MDRLLDTIEHYKLELKKFENKIALAKKKDGTVHRVSSATKHKYWDKMEGCQRMIKRLESELVEKQSKI
jgi:hypothetical protein